MTSLRSILEEACGDGYSLTDLTVLAAQNDPYRLDTPAGHRDGQWCAEQLSRALSVKGGAPHIHLRGLHYSIVARGDVLKPNGKPYVNTDADWQWLQAAPAKAGRWLGYVPFESITDERNSPPIIHRKQKEPVNTWLSIGLEVDIPDASDIEPCAGVSGFVGHQPYHLVIFGEKSSLAEVLLPIVTRFDIDLYLPTGEISDTLLYHMARDGAADGRPMKVFTISDFDPAGYQMPVSIGRKLQALHDLKFPSLDFEVRVIGLTLDQAKRLELPSTPLKETESRADKWRAAHGWEQTEIDALATLRPTELERIVEEAIDTFYDHDLDDRVGEAKSEWKAAAEVAVAEHVDHMMVESLREEAAAKLSELEAQIAELNESLHMATDGRVALPPVVIPEPEVNPEHHPLPFVSSDWDWVDQTKALIARKRYDAS